MDARALPEIVSSPTRLKIASLVSVRPRTLSELADLTAVSVQGVLRHLRKLSELGLVEELRIKGKGITVRRLYASKSGQVGDFSLDDMAVVKFTGEGESQAVERNLVEELKFLSEEALVNRRRVREHVRRLGRLLEELAEEQRRLRETVGRLRFDAEDSTSLMVFFTEETEEDAVRVLKKYYGIADGRRSIEKALSKARRNAKA